MVQKIGQAVASSIRKNIKSATPTFLFVILFINGFQAVFGPENSIVGVILVIIMMASLVRDMTAHLVRHLLMQALVLVMMGVSACLVHTLHPWLALPIHLATLFVILYAFTYEYASHMYFPYILSYLFLVFISPVGPEALPKRLAGLLVGAVSVILYQFFMGRRRVAETAQDVLTTILDEAQRSIDCLLTGRGALADPAQVRSNLCRLSRIVYERRKRVLCVSDAGFAMIDSGRGLEHLILLIGELEHPAEYAGLLRQVSAYLASCAAYVQGARTDLPEPHRAALVPDEGDSAALDFYNGLCYVRAHLLHMRDPDKGTRYRQTALSLSVRVKAAMDVSAVRVVYALRVSLLLATFTLVCQLLELTYGKWLMFTLASLSLPYADDVGAKTRKRIAATLLGGAVSVGLYTLIPSAAGRSAIMMLSGYVSMYLTDYTGTYACSTVGALGGAVFLSAFTIGEIGGVFLIRVGYICLGALLAWLFNCLLLPFKRGYATRLLMEKYKKTTELLSRICQSDQTDPQLYYHLIIQAHLQEDKLTQNAAVGCDEGVAQTLAACRQRVRQAHRRSAGQPAPT